MDECCLDTFQRILGQCFDVENEQEATLALSPELIIERCSDRALDVFPDAAGTALRDWVHPDDFPAFAVTNGPAALDWLTQNTCDVVILDWVLGAPMNGQTVLDAIRQRAPELPVIVSSGFADIPIPPGTPILSKPYTRPTLGETLASVLERSSLHR